MAGLQASFLRLADGQESRQHAQAVAELRAAVVMGRRLWIGMGLDELKQEAMSRVFAKIQAHNLQQPWGAVLHYQHGLLVKLGQPHDVPKRSCHCRQHACMSRTYT